MDKQTYELDIVTTETLAKEINLETISKKTDLIKLEKQITSDLKTFNDIVKKTVEEKYKPYMEKLAEFREEEQQTKLENILEATDFVFDLSNKHKIKDFNVDKFIADNKLGLAMKSEKRYELVEAAITTLKQTVKLLKTTGLSEELINKYKQTYEMSDVTVTSKNVIFKEISVSEWSKVLTFLEKSDIDYIVEDN
jgi:hypothetical protein